MSQQDNIKEIIRKEYILCYQSPIHFMKKYTFIQHPTRGRISFNLFPFQEKVINLWLENDKSIINKSRQLGISTLCAGYALWLMLFHKDKNILCIATKQETAKNMVTKVKFMFNNLPSWLTKGVEAEEENKLTLRLKNGSQIKATSAASDAGRSEAVSLLIIDEAAFIEGIDLIWASAQQTLATGGGAIILSTPFGTGNWFHKTFTKAESRENDFLPIKLPWHLHPERNQAWRDKQDSELGDPRIAAQECDCDFNTSGDVVFFSEWIDFITTTTVKEAVERRGMDKNYWIWEYPDFSRQYLMVADVARGDGKDFSSFHVIDIESNTQVAEYKGQVDTKEFAHILVGVGNEYNQALLVIENTGIGWSTVREVEDLGYRNLYYSAKGEATNSADSFVEGYRDPSNLVAGFTNSLKTRPLVVGKFREYVGDKSVVIRSKRLVEEMKVFIWKNGRAEAQSGYNDDLVMPMGVAMFLRDTSLKYKQQHQDLARATLNNISTQKIGYKGSYSTIDINNPYQNFSINGNKEDLTWLL